RNLRATNKGEHGRRERIGCNIEDEKVNILAANLVARIEPTLRRIDQAEVHNLTARSTKLLFDHSNGSFQPFFETRKLFPVCGKPDSKQTNPKISLSLHLDSFQFLDFIEMLPSLCRTLNRPIRQGHSYQ